MEKRHKVTRLLACSAVACIGLTGCAKHGDGGYGSSYDSSYGSSSYGSSASSRSGGSQHALHARSGMTRQQVFDALDTDHNGLVSQAEAAANPDLVAIFVATDTDSDGSISVVEFAAVPIMYETGTAVGATGSLGGGTK